MDKKNIIYFIQKIIDGTASQEEKAKVDRHFREAFHTEEWDEKLYGSKEDVKERIISGVNEHVYKEKRKPRIFRVKGYIRYAASVVLFLGIAIFVKHYIGQSKDNHVKENPKTSSEVLKPGADIASLQLSDGTVLDLNNLQVGEDVNKSGIVVTKTDAGNLEYAFNGENTTSGTTEWNTLATPVGGKYQIVLIDGTKVWLNSGSSLSFPSRFEKAQRIVKASGEVYFEVAHDSSSPFLVNTEGFEIQVLGTKFNLSTYFDEGIKVSPTLALVEGSVKLKSDEGEYRVLKPGQKAIVSKDGIGVEKFDIESEIAWKDNYFVFKDKNIKEIMSFLSRWYDADVVYAGEEWADKTFTIRMSRRENIQEILAMLELTKSVRFKIEGRRVTVYNK